MHGVGVQDWRALTKNNLIVPSESAKCSRNQCLPAGKGQKPFIKCHSRSLFNFNLVKYILFFPPLEETEIQASEVTWPTATVIGRARIQTPVCLPENRYSFC